MNESDYQVLIQSRAHRDIIRNSQWWAEHHSQEEAEHWQNAIYRKIHSLSEFPFSHSLAYENSDFSYELREALFGLGSRPGYRILFTIVEQTIHVLAVRAAQEDVIIPDELFPPGQTEQESG